MNATCLRKMKATGRMVVVVGVLAMVGVVRGAVLYVNLNSTSPTPPFTSWATAATNIQAAVDAAIAGDEIVVTNGGYATGGRPAGTNLLVNRVLVDKAVTVRSVNGPAATLIVGAGVGTGGTNNGDGAIRCAFVGTGAVLSGFTLTNGHTRTAGDYIKDRSGGGVWCEVSGVVSNCTLVGNSASDYGGGAYSGTLNNCTLSGNSVYYYGGGASGGSLKNCVVSGNAAMYGGGAYSGTLSNCTLTGNSARHSGGGGDWSTLNNCIVYYNSAPDGPNYSSWSTLDHSCATPLAPGPGNIDSEPLLASSSHLSSQSPCIGRGSSAYTSGVDIDGESWLNPPCMGADQLVTGQATGGLSMAITAAYTNVSTGFAVAFVGESSGGITASIWDFGDGVVVSNRPYASHAWSVPGMHEVRLTGYNDSWPDGVSATVVVQVEPREVYYVNGSNTAPIYPYTSWTTAATNIQQAIDAGTQIGRLVLVADGVYGSGGRADHGQMTNRVVVPEGVEVRSVNGPATTRIAGAWVDGIDMRGNPTRYNGDGAIRCAYVGANALLNGFALTEGHTRTAGDYDKENSGGGAWCEISGVVSNCTLSGNSASDCGGGAYGGTLNNCSLTGNRADSLGGGASLSTLNNCMVSDNSAYYGGGAYYGTLDNCTVSGNSAYGSGGGAYAGTLDNCIVCYNWAWLDGGGVGDSTLNNCTLVFNQAVGQWDGFEYGYVVGGNGGGAYGGTMNNCTLIDNWAESGGGASGSTLNNCIVCYNWALNDPNHSSCTFNYSCTTPLPVSGLGNITNEPRFISLAAYNLRLQSDSPCINTGNNAYASGTTDLDGNPRIAGGTVDMGAYEFQGTPAEWLQRLLAEVSSGWARSKPLVAILSAALRSLERGNCHSAINQLGAFQRQARAQVAAADPALAGAFIGSAQNILDALNGCDGGGSGLSHGRFMSAKRQANGHVRLEISADPRSIFILEASTNLVDWEAIGLATEQGDGTFVFEDPDAAKYPRRFYRVARP